QVGKGETSAHGFTQAAAQPDDGLCGAAVRRLPALVLNVTFFRFDPLRRLDLRSAPCAQRGNNWLRAHVRTALLSQSERCSIQIAGSAARHRSAIAQNPAAPKRA